MKTPKIIAFALALFGAYVAPAMAAPITYDVSIPLIADGSVAPTDSLFGRLTYDDTQWTGNGTFTIASMAGATLVSRFFSGWSIIMDAGDSGLGLYFNGSQDDGSGLYFNINTATTADTLSFNNVSYSQATGTSFFTSMGGVVTPITLTGVSPVPLPPAAWLFGGALLGLATRRRLAPLVRVVARRRRASPQAKQGRSLRIVGL